MRKLVIGSIATMGAGLLAACAAKPTPPPAFDANGDLGSQAAQFVEARDAKHAQGLQRVAITSCNVLFGIKSWGSAQTSGGVFNQDNRLEAELTQIYFLQGVEDRELQAVADAICNEAEKRFERSGFEVVKRGALLENELFRKIHAKGQASGYEHVPEKSKTRYRIFTPGGMRVVAGEYLSMSTTFKDIWSSTTKLSEDGSTAQMEGKLIRSLKAAAVHLDVLVDFAAVQSNQRTGFLAKMSGQDTAAVEGRLDLAVFGRMSVATEQGMSCQEFYDRDTSSKWQSCTPRDMATYTSRHPLVSSDKFYTELKDVQSTASKVGEVAANVLGVLAALSGTGGGSTLDYRETGVVADPKAYGDIAKRYSGSFLDMLARTAKSG